MNTAHDSETTLQRIFREVSQQEETSVRALARRLRLRLSTLAEKIRLLERKGLVNLSPSRKTIGLNRNYGCVVGIDMGGSHLHFALADFRGDIVTDSNEKIRPEDGPQKMIAQIKEGVWNLARQAGRGRLRALAIGVPSPIDPERGVVAFANNLPGWKNIHLGNELEKEFRLPVFLENDANMAAMGEHWRGVAQGVNNFVFIALGTGIGSGIFVDGNLHRGRTGNAGELYRLNVEWQRWDEDFQDIGYFESHVSGLGIAAEGRRVLGQKAAGEAAGLAEERDAYFVFEAYRQGDHQARELLEKTFTMLGVGIANLVAVLDPDLIVLGGGVTKGAPDFLLATAERVVRRIQPDDPPPIKLSALEDKAQTYGAIYSALAVAREAITRRLR
jgi:predicted NBD/HSP70 family sugar kinase